jgi:hypothetical protein
MEHYGCTQENCHCACHLDQACHQEGHNHAEEMKAEYFLALADEAWEEVLKDKIKEYILQTQNDPMLKLAKLVAEGNHQRWRTKMEKRQNSKDFMEEICKFFDHPKK